MGELAEVEEEREKRKKEEEARRRDKVEEEEQKVRAGLKLNLLISFCNIQIINTPRPPLSLHGTI